MLILLAFCLADSLIFVLLSFFLLGAIPCRIVFGENDDSRKSDPKRRAHAEKIKAMLEQAGIITTLHEDIQVARWEKLGIIAGRVKSRAKREN